MFDNSDLQSLGTASGYTFSAPPDDAIGASEYTLATLVLDESGSVDSFKSELENIAKTVVEACQKSPRAENLMFRFTKFNTRLNEVHGFRLLGSINPNDYKGTIHPSGGTALFDSVYEALEATEAYGKQLVGPKHGCTCNAVIFVGTDGEDNSSKFTPKAIKQIQDRIAKSETLESVAIVLIGVTGGGSGISSYLDSFKNEAGIAQYVQVHSITPQNVAKLAAFVSKSISSTSQALGSGGPSQPLPLVI